MVNGCRGNKECRTILLAAFLRVLHTVRSRLRLLRELGFRFHQLRIPSRRGGCIPPGLKSKGKFRPPSTSEIEEESLCDGYEEEGHGAREGVDVPDDSEDERPRAVSSSVRTRLSAGVAVATPSWSELDKNSYASFDG